MSPRGWRCRSRPHQNTGCGDAARADVLDSVALMEPRFAVYLMKL